MNDRELIKKLHTLKHLEPGDKTMASIKQKVFEETHIGKKSNWAGISEFLRSFFMPNYQLALAFVLVLLVLGVAFFRINPMNEATLSMDIAVKSLQNTTKDQIFSQEIHLDLAHAQLASLNLNGEPGKYTREQCHQIYETYEQYLATYKERLRDVKNDPKATALSDKITRYQKEIEAKWPNR